MSSGSCFITRSMSVHASFTEIRVFTLNKVKKLIPMHKPKNPPISATNCSIVLAGVSSIVVVAISS
ncbi:hypothetical protein BpHYR1_008776 [Brachionus plicatilis]|uniref:Uncharacterized protein n=1 Tax=Brachionus plicatilis TaxID=10195 RepID=A0A3M7PCN7_BRAPC|nr:hypothetical protein BpHYR1_008776 [Brachionus plicatilis]